MQDVQKYLRERITLPKPWLTGLTWHAYTDRDNSTSETISLKHMMADTDPSMNCTVSCTSTVCSKDGHGKTLSDCAG